MEVSNANLARSVKTLEPLTRHLLDDITSVFSLNCIKPWDDCDDVNKLGRIPTCDFVNAARQLGFVFTTSESRAIYRKLKDSNLDYINIDQFIQLLNNKVKLDNTINLDLGEFPDVNLFFRKELEKCYKFLDYQKAGKLPAADLKHMLSSLNNGELNTVGFQKLYKEAKMETASERERIPRSEKKRRKKALYREKRRLKRAERNRESRRNKQEMRSLMLSQMTSEERMDFLMKEKIKKQEKMLALENAYENGVGICINCCFHNTMNEKESKSLAKQISVTYNMIKKRSAHIKLILSGLQTTSILYEHCMLFGIQNWKVHRHDENYWEFLDQSKIIVLSPDAPEVLETVDPDNIYVIGGLVDVHVKKVWNLYKYKKCRTRHMPKPKNTICAQESSL
ncbi:bifunctional EF-hand domain pair/tRNA (guanine-N1-)-methyltransferase [Babesia duncani]|uniref:tRNA (guanine(9)-N(1))-methyltransferase n=1 Tax=Babesia duncani TaxID=323732 RepID=A0AAD9PP85_9APIC|nr:bifunctional EF-hand domain pair/tRNA (guanine-N1-)-methyltransferase [Babesia duncani]